MIRTFVLLLLTVSNAMAQATFHGDAARTGVYPSAGPLQLNGTKWTFKTDGPIIGSPTIAAGVVYIGSTDGNFYAVDQEKLMWDFQTEGSKRDPLKMLKPDGGLNNEAIYARYFGDYQDMVLAFYRVFSVGAVWSSPVVDKGVVYFGSTDGSLYAIH